MRTVGEGGNPRLGDREIARESKRVVLDSARGAGGTSFPDAPLAEGLAEAGICEGVGTKCGDREILEGRLGERRTLTDRERERTEE